MLIKYLGQTPGGKLKETGIEHWLSPNTGATNESGFSALPGGYRDYNAKFNFLGKDGYWWTSTENADNAWYVILTYNSTDILGSLNDKKIGFSVRCIKDK